MQTGIINQDDSVGPLVAKIAVRFEDQPDERHQVEQDVQEPHDRKIHQRIHQRRAGLSHPRSAKAVELGVGNTPPQRLDQVGRVEIATGFARRDEESHEGDSPPCPRIVNHPVTDELIA